METFENNENQLNFRYNRSERLKNAPQNVKDYYDGNMNYAAKGLFKTLFSNKMSRITFLALICCVGISFMLGSFLPKENQVDVEDITIELTVVTLEDTVYCSILFPVSKVISNREEFVFVDFLAYDEKGNLISKETDSGIYTGEKKYFRTKFTDFDLKKIVCNLDFYDKIYILKSDVN